MAYNSAKMWCQIRSCVRFWIRSLKCFAEFLHKIKQMQDLWTNARRSRPGMCIVQARIRFYSTNWNKRSSELPQNVRLYARGNQSSDHINFSISSDLKNITYLLRRNCYIVAKKNQRRKRLSGYNCKKADSYCKRKLRFKSSYKALNGSQTIKRIVIA